MFMYREKMSFSKMSIILYILKVLYNLSTIMYIDLIDNILLALALAFSVAELLVRRYRPRNLIITFGGALLCFWSSYINGNYSICITYFMIVMLMNIDIEWFINCLYKMQKWFVGIHLCYSVVAMLYDKTMVYKTYSDGIRFLFCTKHPNIFSLIIVSIIIMWFWCNFNKKIKLKSIVFVSLVMLSTYFFTGTDGVLINFVLLLFVLMARKYNLINEFFYISAKYGVPIMGFMTVLLGYLYNASSGVVLQMVRTLDVILSRRIAMFSFAQSLNSIKLFASKVNLYKGYNFEYGLSGFNLDNVYIALLLNYGLIYLIIISVAFWILANKKNIKINFFITVFAMYGFIEAQIMVAAILPTIALISVLFHKNVKHDEL